MPTRFEDLAIEVLKPLKARIKITDKPGGDFYRHQLEFKTDGLSADQISEAGDALKILAKNFGVVPDKTGTLFTEPGNTARGFTELHDTEMGKFATLLVKNGIDFHNSSRWTPPQLD